MTFAEDKTAARHAAFAARKAVCTPERQTVLAVCLSLALKEYQGQPLAGYLPIRTEADPLSAMANHAADAEVGVPVVTAKGAPLVFRRWTPGCALSPGAFGVMIPLGETLVTPRIVIVPMAAFDGRGYRLGYGGGFYDRTLEQLRAAGPVTAIGLAFAGQEVPVLPVEPTDQPLDAIVTEVGLRRF